MRLPRLRAIALAALIAGVAPGARAQCAGFSDVSTSSSFCGNVVWMKNRGVTQGCTGTTYCPGDNVTRLAMAAFLNRTGNVLTPQVFSVEDSGGTLGPSATTVCETPTIAGIDYHRTAQVDAKLSFDGAITGAGERSVRLEVAVSKNGGPWQTPQFGGGAGVDSVPRRHAHAMLSSYPLTDGAAVMLKFALQVTLSSGGDPFLLGTWACHLDAHIRNAVQ